MQELTTRLENFLIQEREAEEEKTEVTFVGRHHITICWIDIFMTYYEYELAVTATTDLVTFRGRMTWYSRIEPLKFPSLAAGWLNTGNHYGARRTHSRAEDKLPLQVSVEGIPAPVSIAQ